MGEYAPIPPYAEGLIVLKVLLVAAVIALLPAYIAHRKGHNFLVWYAYGVVFWLLAVIHVLVLEPRPRFRDFI